MADFARQQVRARFSSRTVEKDDDGGGGGGGGGGVDENEQPYSVLQLP